MKIHILSLFPAYFEGPFSESMLNRAQERGLVTIELVDIRDFARSKHRRVDDRPYGGGPGMVLMAEPVSAAIRGVKREGAYVVYMSPKGKRLDALLARRLSEHSSLVVVCGHYEGVDERVLGEVDEEVSLGDFVLTNGCLAACALVDAVVRFVPGVLGDVDSAQQDSFERDLLDHPAFTRPLDFEGRRVPEVLLGGDHGRIARHRYSEALALTTERRPDLAGRHLSALWESDEAIEVALEVADLEASCQFFRKVLGWKARTLSEGVRRVEGEAGGLLLIEQERPQRSRVRFKGCLASYQQRMKEALADLDVVYSSFCGREGQQVLEFKDLNGHHFLCVEA